MFMILVNRPGKSGGSWELSSKKIFGLKEKYLAQIIFCESHNSKLMKVERAKTLAENYMDTQFSLEVILTKSKPSVSNLIS